MPDDLNRFTRDLFDGLPARYDRLAELLSFGQNGQWRAEMVSHVVPRNKGDGLRFWLGPRKRYDAAAPAEAIAEKIRAALPAP